MTTPALSPWRQRLRLADEAERQTRLARRNHADATLTRRRAEALLLQLRHENPEPEWVLAARRDELYQATMPRRAHRNRAWRA